MKQLALTPTFLVGLAVRLVLIALVVPTPLRDWYLPFMESSVREFSLDPWSSWLDSRGSSAAFPYGYVMWIAFLPGAALCSALGISLAWGYGGTLLVADVALLLLLGRMFPTRPALLLAAYWLSPIVIVASYVLGFNDVVPVALLVGALLAAKRHRFGIAGALLVAAISAKLSMALALPFFFVYLLQNRSVRSELPAFLKGLAVATVLLLLPFFVSSPSGVNMLSSNPEIGKVYRLSIDLADMSIYVVPLAYLLMLYATWRIRRPNYDLFFVMLGLAFLLVILMTPASPGWFVWAVPLLVAYQVSSDRFAIALCGIFSLLYVVTSLLHTDGGWSFLRHANRWDAVYVPSEASTKLTSLTLTALVAVGAVLAVRIWRETVSRNDYFRLSRKPFVLGVSGDSGAGKDTFADAMAGLFGAHSVTSVSGDDYHLWDRQKPMWQVMTHLNPRANDLEQYSSDVIALTDGKAIQTRHYDHATGRMSRPFRLRSNDFIIASGLHALYLPILRDRYDLSVYLDIDEGLRRYFKLERDVHQRGHSVERVLASLDRRAPDSERFIRPQAAHADLVLSLQPIHPRMLDELGDGRSTLRFKLVARSRRGLNEHTLNRVLIGVCGLHVDMTSQSDATEVELTIEGETFAADVALAARMVCPRVFEFLDVEPTWQDGMLGLMQLVTLAHIDHTLTKRIL